jgi:DMATS type aromatic prenyltransferase
MKHREARLGGARAVPSYVDHGVERLGALCRACDLGDSGTELIDIFRWLIEPWGEAPVGSLLSDWASDVADDHTPYEFSVVFGGRCPEVRVLVEAQGEPRGLRTNWDAGLALSQRLAERFGVPLDRHDAVLDLFAPEPGARLGIWHAVSAWPDRPPQFKVYFDSQAHGRWRAPAVMEEALDRLGFSRAWPHVRSLGGRGLSLADMRFLSLDLSSSQHARVKVYWRHHDATAADLAHVMSGHAADPEIISFCRAMAASEGPYHNRPVFTCTTLVDPAEKKPRTSTLYFPIVAYASTDRTAADRVEAYFAARGIDDTAYRRAIAEYGNRDLHQTSSLHSYVSLRRRADRPEVTVYFTPEAHAIEPARPSPAAASGTERLTAPATEIVRRYEEEILLADHPFLCRLGREPVALPHLWLILANFWEAIVSDFPARLAHVIARIDDDRVRCLFVKQLNDELGEGDFSRAHKAMFQRLLDALEPYRMRGDPDRLLAPGRVFGLDLKRHLYSDEPHEAIGALMMIEIYGKQTDVLLGEEFRRQAELPAEALTWLRLHEELEVDHAEDSRRVAEILPQASDGPEAERRLQAVWQGAEGVVHASMRYFDGLYEVCYAEEET